MFLIIYVNTVCCKKLLSKEDIIQNHSHRAINIFSQARDDDVYNDKSTLKTVPFVVLQPQPIVIQDNGCYESTPGEFKTTKLWKTYGLFTSLSSSVLYWIQTYLCLWSISLRWRMRACGDVRRALLQQDSILFLRLSIEHITLTREV